MTTATAHAPIHRVPFTQAIRHTLVITKRNLLRNVRLPQLLLFSTVQPVMFLLLFNYVFGGAIGGVAGGKYIDFLLPGILVQTAVFGATQTTLGLTEDLNAGVIDRFRSLPIARSAVLAGRTIADVVRSGFVTSLMIAVGYLIGFRPQNGFLALVAGVALSLAFGYAMSWVMASIGLAVKTPEAAQSAGFISVFPLVFASSVFVSTQTMPGWLRAFADHQPVTVVANALRGIILGSAAIPPDQTVAGLVLTSLAWVVGIVAVFGFLGVRLYRRAVS